MKALIPQKPPQSANTRLIGYARVSTQEQNLEAQMAALKSFGVLDGDLFVEKVSAVSSRRPQWALLRKFLVRGDTLVVYSLSRIGRSLPHLLQVNKELLDEGVMLKSLTEPIDTRTADGKLMFNIRAAFAQFERDVTIERTRNGIANRRAQGHQIGRERSITDDIVKKIKRDLKDPKMTVKLVAKRYKISVASVYAYVRGGKSAVVR